MELDKRVVRVFISSTFKDMHSEREELVKFTFSELRRRCRARRVEFTGIDLRWGITDEQAAEGRVLPICLAEIEACRPYFIGLLGERYGWLPRRIDPQLFRRERWLEKHRAKSVTEFEILHGVLNNPAMEGLAFFYFRNKEASEAVERVLSAESGYVSEPKTSRAKLEALKRRIESSGYPLRKDFPDARTLGQWILDDLWSAIDKRYPIEKIPDELQQRRMEHEGFASLRTQVYIADKLTFKLLKYHARGDGPPLIILGESGSGKSALLANWAESYKREHPEDFIICHYVGSTTDSADYAQILRRIMEEIRDKYEPESRGKDNISRIRNDTYIPADSSRMAEAFPGWLARAAAKGRLILVLDGLNQLEDRDSAPDLGWLPSRFPPNVRLIVSTIPGRSLDALKKRDWTEFTLDPMKNEDRKKYVAAYLARFGKSLEDSQVDRIVSAKQTANPLYVRTLLEELRIIGRRDELNKEIQRYLEAESVEALFILVLDRLEKVYERERRGLVGEVMTLIAASRKGLSETEILELLGSEGKPMPRAIFSPLFLALEESLVNRSGLLTFFHDFLRAAVESRYLDGPRFGKAHLQIADYFNPRPLDDRKLEELPWQLNQAAAWSRLKDCISDMEVFPRLVRTGRNYELMGYWQALADKFDIVSACNRAIEQYEASAHRGNNLAYRLNQTAFFLMLYGKYAGAEPLFRRALKIRIEALGPNHLFTATSYLNLAWFHETMGRYEEALPLYCRALDIRRRVQGEQHVDVTDVLASMANLFEMTGDLVAAEAFYMEAWTIRDHWLGPQHPKAASCIHSLGWIYYRLGKYETASAYCRKALSIRENVLGPEHPHTSSSMNNLALIYRAQHDYPKAMPLIEKALCISGKIYGLDHPETAMNMSNYGLLLIDTGDYDKAEIHLRKALEIRQRIFGTEHPLIVGSLENLARLFKAKGDDLGALPFQQRALAIAKAMKARKSQDRHPQSGP